MSRFIRRMFLPFSGQKNQFKTNGSRGKSRKKNFDQIEEADYEDLSDKKN